jgi:hypothetical protein
MPDFWFPRLLAPKAHSRAVFGDMDTNNHKTLLFLKKTTTTKLVLQPLLFLHWSLI